MQCQPVKTQIAEFGIKITDSGKSVRRREINQIVALDLQLMKELNQCQFQ